MVAHKPSIMAEGDLHPDSILGSLYKKNRCLRRMVPSIQEQYNQVMDDEAWRSKVYELEAKQAQLVNKVKFLLPFIPNGVAQVCNYWFTIIGIGD